MPQRTAASRASSAGIAFTRLPFALRARRVPGIATFAAADETCARIPVSRQDQEPRSNVALVLCRGFAATDGALVVRTA